MAMEYSTKKHFMVLETVFFWMEIGTLKIEVAALLLRGARDSHCLQMLSFKHLEIQLLNVRLYHYSWPISLHLSLCAQSFVEGSSGLLGLVLLLVVHSDSVLQRNTPFEKREWEVSLSLLCCWNLSSSLSSDPE